MHISLSYNIDSTAKASFSLCFELSAALPIEHNIVGVFGQSGAGKSTILKVMAGLYKSAQYQFEWQGENVTNTKDQQNPCVYVGEDTPLFEHLSVQQNLDLVNAHAQTAQSRKLSKQMIISMCKVESLLTQQVRQLSSGEKQRVNFARALMSGKSILLLDEAFSALDWHTRSYMQSVLLDLVNHHDYYCVMVSHSLKEISICCQYLWQIQEATLVRQGETQALLTDIMCQDKKSAHSYFSVIQASFLEHEVNDENLQIWLLDDPDSEDNSIDEMRRIYVKADRHEETLARIDNQQSQSFVINADAVSISLREPDQSSMLNKFTSQITAINKTSTGVLVSLLVGKHLIRSLITHKSLVSLNLKVSDEVFAVFKALDKQAQD